MKILLPLLTFLTITSCTQVTIHQNTGDEPLVKNYIGIVKIENQPANAYHLKGIGVATSREILYLGVYEESGAKIPKDGKHEVHITIGEVPTVDKMK